MSNIFNQLKGALTNLRATFPGHDDHYARSYQHGIHGIPIDGKKGVVLKNSKLKSKGYLVRTVHKGASTNLRATFSGHDDDDNPYQHGIPGIPTDGKVVLLKNSKLKSKVYLVGTVHISKQSAETVKKVINYVKPNVVAVELCSESADAIMTCNLKEDVTLLDILYRSMTAPWGLRMKLGMFAVDCWNLQLRADGILQGLEFKVAIQESSKLGARCVLMDQDHNVTDEKISEVLSWNLLWNCLLGDYKDLLTTEYATRSSAQEEISLMKKQNPEFNKVLIEDRDKIMFERIRVLEKKVVAVVGMGHMDGIESLWKHAEEGDNKQPALTSG